MQESKSRVALAYFGVYWAYLFLNPESEREHWATLVLIPAALAYISLPHPGRSLSHALASVGLRRDRWKIGLGWAIGIGVAIGLLQTFAMSQGEAIRATILSGKALYLFPITFALMLVMAGFTEEFFFRGFLQTRLQESTGRTWVAVGVTSLLFGVYHLPYAYLNPNWPSAGDWGAAWGAALGNGVPGGLVLGILYARSRNLVAPIVLHSLINAMPVMTRLEEMLRF
jgi:membrane protease YdiL (CAAX protease family)